MKLSPRNAKGNQIINLNSDNKSTENYWILLGEDSVTITEQAEGENAKDSITFEKNQFNRLIDWYNRKQIIKE